MARLTLRELMLARGLTVADLAERSGYSQEQIRRVMRGSHGGAPKFHAAMHLILGDEYKTVAPVARQERTAR